MGELGERRRDFQAHVEDLLLALETDILGPLDEAGEVPLGLDILTDAEVAGTGLDERVLGQRNPISALLKRGHRGGQLTLVFLAAPALPWGNGAGAAFFFAGYGH